MYDVLKLPKWLWLQKEADKSETSRIVWSELRQISEYIGKRWRVWTVSWVNAGHWETGSHWQSWSYFCVILVKSVSDIGRGHLGGLEFPMKIYGIESCLLDWHSLNNDISIQFPGMLFPFGSFLLKHWTGCLPKVDALIPKGNKKGNSYLL